MERQGLPWPTLTAISGQWLRIRYKLDLEDVMQQKECVCRGLEIRDGFVWYRTSSIKNYRYRADKRRSSAQLIFCLRPKGNQCIKMQRRQNRFSALSSKSTVGSSWFRPLTSWIRQLRTYQSLVGAQMITGYIMSIQGAAKKVIPCRILQIFKQPL